MTEPRLTITSGMRRFLDYPKFARPTVRVLVLEAGYFFDQGWVRAAESLGWEARTVPSVITGGLTADDVQRLFTTLGEFQPDFIIGSNYAGMDATGLFARFFEDAKIPHVSWFADTPRMILHDRVVHCSPYSVVATWERAYIPHLKKLGFEHVIYMPLATDPALFHGEPGGPVARPLAFVGTSMIEQAQEAWEKLNDLPDVVRALLEAFEAGLVTRERFAQGISAILGQDALEGRSPRELRIIELCLVYEATRRQRAEMALALEPLGLEVRGDPNWRQVLARVDGPVGYYDDLAGFYRTTAINVNNTSLQMKTTVNQRVFDCPAAGGFLITDKQTDLLELFDKSEVVTYETLDELRDKVTYYLNKPDERSEIVRRAQRRVSSEHTLRHRLETLVAYLRERYE